MAIFAWPSVLSDHPTCSGGYYLERGGIPLHDAVGINCEKGANCLLASVPVLFDLT